MGGWGMGDECSLRGLNPRPWAHKTQILPTELKELTSTYSCHSLFKLFLRKKNNNTFFFFFLNDFGWF